MRAKRKILQAFRSLSLTRILQYGDLISPSLSKKKEERKERKKRKRKRKRKSRESHLKDLVLLELEYIDFEAEYINSPPKISMAKGEVTLEENFRRTERGEQAKFLG